MEEDPIIEKNGKKFIDVVKILPKSTGENGKPILWEDLGDERIEVSVQRFGIRGGNAKPIIMKRFIPICPLLFEGSGLWLGDGIKIHGVAKVFGFSNTEIKLHKHFLRFSEECLGIFSDEFNARISVPPKLKDNVKNIKRHVSKELKIPLDRFWKSQVLESRNEVCIDVKISSRILALTIESLFLSTISLMRDCKEFGIGFLKEIVATEGNVHVRKCGRLGEVMIAAHRKDIRFLIRKLLENFGIKPNKDKELEGSEGVVIHGFQNFKIIKNNDLCVLHPLKNRNLIKGIDGFKEIQFRKGEGQIVILKNILNGSTTSSELSEKLNRCQHTINFHLRKLHKNGLIDISKINGRKIIWAITKKGEDFLDIKKEEIPYFY